MIYFWELQPEVFFMLYAYRKSEAEDITAAQLKFLKRLVTEEFK